MTTNTNTTRTHFFTIRTMTQIAVLSAIAFILMLFEFPLFFIPNFYKLDLSEIPVLIGALTLGPVAGAIIEFIKILLNLVFNGTYTAGVGELANFAIGCALVVPAGIIYKHKRTLKNCIVGLAVGILFMTIIGSLFNAYVLLPLYSKAIMPLDSIISMGTQLNPYINSLSTFVIFAVAPFNLIKGLLVSVVTILLYKRIILVIKDI